MVSGNMPAFSAGLSSGQTITTGSFTKITCQYEQFDTNNNYDNSTNYRFTPTVAGYYLLTGAASFYATQASNGTVLVTIYKNGSELLRGARIAWITNQPTTPNVSGLVYFNGSTDYAELYCYQSQGNSLNLDYNGTTPLVTYFQGYLVRTT
jgi:hypothetical protein